MTTFLVVLTIIIILFTLYLLALKGRSNTDMSVFEKYDFAHRGLFEKGVIPENSMAAFRLAKDNGFGVELDVHLLSDGGLAVFHDDNLKRMTGIDRKISDITTNELGMYYLDETSETIPNFYEVLKLFDGKVPLIIELKAFDKNYPLLCKTVCDALDNYNGAYCIESFDPRCILWLKQNRPDIIRGQLAHNYFKGSTIKSFFIKLFLTSLAANFINKPDFISYNHKDRNDLPYKLSKKLWKIKGVGWTVKSQDDLDKTHRCGEIAIFEGFIPK